MTRVGIGIIGAGYMGRTHAATYSLLPDVDVVAVYDVSGEAAAELAQNHGARATSSIEELLTIDGLDAVSICTPDAQHREPAVLAAQHGKHILLEKPIATSEADAEAIIDAVTSNGVVLALGFVSRGAATYAPGQQRVAAGELGDLITIAVKRHTNQGTGAAYQMRDHVVEFLSVHDIDILRWFGGEIEQVSADANAKVFKDGIGPDTAVAMLRFSSGALGVLQTSWALPTTAPYRAHSTLEVLGSQGILSIDSFDDRVLIATPDGISYPLNWELADAFRTQAQAFLNSVRNGDKPLASGEDGLRALQVVSAIKQSLAEGQAISIPARD